MRFLLSIGNQYFSNFDDDWIYLFLDNDIKKNIGGCEIHINISDQFQRAYVQKTIKNSLLENWNFQFHGPDLSEYSGNYLDVLNFYNDISQFLGYKVKVTFHPITSKIDINDSINLSEKTFYEVSNLIAKYNLGIIPLVENLNIMGNPCRCQLQHIESLLKIENLNFTWDIGHQAIDNTCTYSLKDNYLNKLQNIHIHDISIEDHYPFYYGKIDLQKSISYLVENNYNENIVLEIGLPCLNSTTFDKKIAEYIENVNLLADTYKMIINKKK